MPLTTASLKGTDMLVAKESFIGQLPSGADFIAKANVTRVRSTDPAAKLWPKLFKPLDVSYPYLEQATAAPGEMRGEVELPEPEKPSGLTTANLRGA